jgi:hypothetical protein
MPPQMVGPFVAKARGFINDLGPILQNFISAEEFIDNLIIYRIQDPESSGKKKMFI